MIDRSILKKTWKKLTECSGLFLWAIFFKTFFTALKPFVFLHFSASIINELYAGRNGKEILFQAFLLSVSVMVIEIVCHLSVWYVDVVTRKLSYDQSRELSERAMRMDYQQLESSRVQSLIENIRQCKFQRGDVFAKEIQFFDNFLTGLFMMVVSVGYICRFAEEKIHSGADSVPFITLLVCFLLLMIIVAAAAAKNGAEHNKNIFRRFTEVAPINRRYGFYRKNVFQNYQFGKEIRIFDESGLILDEFGRILKDVGSFMRAVGRQEGIFRIVNNVLNVILSGIAYVYIGFNAWRRVIGVGNIVKYSGAVAQLFTGITQTVGALADLKGNEKFLQQYYNFLEMEILPEAAETGQETAGTGLEMAGTAPETAETAPETTEAVLKAAETAPEATEAVLKAAETALETTEAVLKAAETAPETAKSALEPGRIEIDFERVYFKYQNAAVWALEDVSFHISDQEHVAMVGRNGSGKTTCIRLLMRLYRPDSGRILLNGVDIWQYREEYWKLISAVFQDFRIFSFSLRQNMEAGHPGEEQRLWKALCAMGMDQAVQKMYAGMDSCLYKDYDRCGILISGGEAQKLAIAKALYKDAPVVIMDEPSAALDPVSEAELYEKTNALMKEKTMILISHRLTSCCFCDRIFVWKEGRLTETGTHRQLLELGGEYGKLWEAQSRHYQITGMTGWKNA